MTTSLLACARFFLTLNRSSECFVFLNVFYVETLLFPAFFSVVTGVRLRKLKNVIHLQIQTGKMLPYGAIDPTTVHWVPIDEFERNRGWTVDGVDYHTLRSESDIINTDDVQVPGNYVVTGVRFGYIPFAYRLNFEIHVTDINFESSKWIFNDQNKTR